MCILLRRLRRQVLSSKSTKAEKSSALLCQMFDILYIKNAPKLGKILTNGSHQICSREILMCARVPNLHSCRRPNCTPKVPNFGFGSHPCSQRETQWCQKNSREREKGSRLLLHTQTRARKGEERERVRSFNHEEVQREFVSKLTRYE